MRRALTAAVLLTLALPGAASAHAKPKTVHCKSGYAREARKVKERRHGKTIHVRVEVCVKRKASKATPETLAPSAPAVKRTVKLHAHLDPTLARDPTNPFQVTYSYSASATTETLTDGAALDAPAEPTSLPDGVLTLYNEGLLACSINVGAETTGGECPILYSSLGDHTVTTIYTAGEGSATETETENIEPFATTTTVSARYEQLPQSVRTLRSYEHPLTVRERDGEAVEERFTFYSWRVGYLQAMAPVSDASGGLGEGIVRWEGISRLAPATFPVEIEEHIAEYRPYDCEEHASCTGTYAAWQKEVTVQSLPTDATLTGTSTLSNGFAPSEASTTVHFNAQLIYPEGDEP
ncbi:MAG: hypothetical protein WAU69_08405 [Solirubrobacteraceae bacterium]